MKQSKFGTITADPKEEKLRKILESIKTGYFVQKAELAKELGCKERVVEKWMKQWGWMKDYRVYIRQNGAAQRSMVFVNVKFKAQLLKQGIAAENY
jgi:uncharacterized protein YjcR